MLQYQMFQIKTKYQVSKILTYLIFVCYQFEINPLAVKIGCCASACAIIGLEPTAVRYVPRKSQGKQIPKYRKLKQGHAVVNIKTRHRSRIKIAFREHENSHDSKSIYKNINEKKSFETRLNSSLTGSLFECQTRFNYHSCRIQLSSCKSPRFSLTRYNINLDLRLQLH